MELLIAFSLIALVSLLLFSGLRLGMRAWQGVDATSERTAEQRVARNFLERALSQARPVSLTLNAEPVMVFGGDASQLEFVAPLSGQVGVPGLYILRLSLVEQDPAKLMLTRWLLHPDVLKGTSEIPEWQPFDGRAQPPPHYEEDKDVAAGAYGSTVLMEGIDAFRIDYYGPTEDEAVERTPEITDADWHEDWLERPAPPWAVRLRMTGGGTDWPDMLIPLPAPNEG